MKNAHNAHGMVLKKIINAHGRNTFNRPCAQSLKRRVAKEFRGTRFRMLLDFVDGPLDRTEKTGGRVFCVFFDEVIVELMEDVGACRGKDADAHRAVRCFPALL